MLGRAGRDIRKDRLRLPDDGYKSAEPLVCNIVRRREAELETPVAWLAVKWTVHYGSE